MKMDAIPDLAHKIGGTLGRPIGLNAMRTSSTNDTDS
jgi:hypothetical protein